ncbi:MBL fold metallo-hydrolase [Piscinibacter sp.]|jgi:metallo-beta-lactamase family protein|uniref:MBL fold metallo-hydrolase n=1 Tax=Piscinibacter sp. TaxID=1903157 RepID=UPI0035596406
MKLSFLGGTGTVTGSKYLVEHAGHHVLVDCGLFQGYKNLRLRNWAPMPFAAGLHAVVLTHAHIDHSGALPLLLRHGYRGSVLASPASIELCSLLLPDSGHLQEEEAAYLNRHHASKHTPALPLYTEDEARSTLPRLRPLPFGDWTALAPGLRARLRPAGHILGAGSVELETEHCRVLFSGDLGRPDDPVMRAPAPIDRADIIVVESTYGDRLHDTQDNEAAIGEVITRTAARGGSVVVPAFAVGRAQSLLHAVHRLKARGAIPDLPVFLDSPMAVDMTDIYRRFRSETRLTAEDCAGMCAAAKMVRSVDESRALNEIRYPAVIISASGMATGGRVLHHLKTRASDRRNTLLFCGYQAPGTRGARIVAGEKTIRIFGEDVAVNAEVVSLQGMSAHADAAQIVNWLRSCSRAPQRVFVTHGDPGPADALRLRIERELAWHAEVPLLGETVQLPD